MAENKTEKTIREWSPNEKQRAFMEILKEYPDGVTLKDIELDKGVVFATGCINVLVSKNLVGTSDSVRVSDIIYRGVKIGEKNDKVKKYFLA